MVEEIADEVLPERWSASSEHTDMWMDPADDPRDTGTELGDERAILVDYLRVYRLTMEMKCAGLDAEQLARRSVPPSTMSLLGLIRHMADVERKWFRRVMAGEDAPPLYWSEAMPTPSGTARAPIRRWSRGRGRPGATRSPTPSATSTAPGTWASAAPCGTATTVSLREVLVHMIEEYARHCGHADLLRERIDGRVGQ